MDEIRILSPTAILGYGFPPESLEEGMRRKPHAIAVDAGSTDAGPYYLGIQAGSGELGNLGDFIRTMTADLRPLLREAVKAGIPLIIGSAGGAGGNLHMTGISMLVKKIAEQEGLKFRLGMIKAEIDPAVVKRKLLEGRITPLGPVPELTVSDVDRAVRIVAQMGIEPFVRGLNLELR